jgi:ketosteroid isomerase-like protein
VTPRSRCVGISGRSYIGHGGIREYFEDIESAWAEWNVDVERVAEGDDGRVAIVMTMRARGKGSGIEVDERTAHIWTLGDGLLLRNELYRDPDEALRALGLPVDPP